MDWPEIPERRTVSFTRPGRNLRGGGGHSNAMRKDTGIGFEGTALPPPPGGRELSVIWRKILAQRAGRAMRKRNHDETTKAFIDPVFSDIDLFDDLRHPGMRQQQTDV